MSDEQSNFDKKPPKKASGSGSELKVPPKKSKDYTVYFEAKGNEKGPKDQSTATKGNAPSGHHDDSHGHKTDSHGSNKPKTYAKNRKESRDHHPNAWKRKHPKVSKDSILDFYLKAPLSKEIDELVSSCGQLFVHDKLIPVNQEDFHLDPNEGLMPKNTYAPNTTSGSTASTTATSLTSLPGTSGSTAPSSNAPTTEKIPTNPAPTANISTSAVNSSAPTTTSQAPTATASASTTMTSNTPATNNPVAMDPIQAMREKMKRDKAVKEKATADANKLKEEQEKKNAAEEQKAAAPTGPQDQGKNKPQEITEGENAEKYSDIDELYERKLKNNELEEGKNEGEEENLKEGLEDNQRPEWEGNQVREIGREEFLANLPQDKRTIFGEKYVEKQQQQQQQGMRNEDGVDFSKLSFDNETKARINDNFNIPSSDMYGGRGMPQTSSQDNINMGGFGGTQNNMYRGAQTQSMQQQQPMTPTSNSKQAPPPSIIFKYFSPNYDTKVWSYIDLEQKLQGPFSGRTMDEWYAKGYLPLTLHVTIGKNNGFKVLQELADIIINHNTQEGGQQQPKEQKIPSATSLPEQQYYQQQQQQPQYYQQQQQQPQYQQQQQQQQYYQQQQQYQPQSSQYQQQQQQQQQQYYRQGSAQEMQQRFHSDTSSYGTNFQTAANRTKAYEGSEVSNTYYGQQGQGQGQYGTQAQGSHDYTRSASATDLQSQNYYQNYNYYGQEPQQQKTAQQNYPTAYKAGPGMGQPSSSYYQQESSGYQGAYGQQTGYNQPQKGAATPTQWKGGQQGSVSGYPGQQQQQHSMASSGGYGGQNMGYGGQQQRDFNAASYGFGGQQQSGQQNMGGYGGMQQQMLNRGGSMGSMGTNPNMSGDMLKNMLGMQRPGSRQEEPDY